MANRNAIHAAILRLLRPLVRLLLRNGVPFGMFADLAKRVYIEVAQEEFAIPGRKQTNSRVSVLTGLSRKEVLRISRLPMPDDSATAERYNRAARVISGWVRDSRYRDGDGNPEPLPMEGDGAAFTELVKTYSGDVPARAVLDELLRVGAAERDGNGNVRLLSRGYIPATGEVEKIGILGADVSDLIATIDHNLQASRGDAFFQRKTAYDNLPDEAVERLRAEIAAHAEEFLERADRRLAEHDRDIQPSVSGKGRRRAGLGIFWFEDKGKGEP
jgi:hypothetical protein